MFYLFLRTLFDVTSHQKFPQLFDPSFTLRMLAFSWELNKIANIQSGTIAESIGSTFSYLLSDLALLAILLLSKFQFP